MDPQPNLVGTSRAELAALLAAHDPRPFRVSQVYHWVTRRLAASLDEMTDLPAALRAGLAGSCRLADPDVVAVRRAGDGTAKYGLRLGDGAIVEAVVMPMEGRTTICLSSQGGCAVGCVFCVTGALGAGRNLTGGEIFGQFRAVVRAERLLGSPLNVVFMGMGEPLLNLPGVTRALDLLAELVSPRRVTVSTAGIVPGIRVLADLPRRPNLAISLNATTDEQRRALMPVAARWSLDELLATLHAYPLERGRRITVEYVLIAGVNDGLEDAARLPALLRRLPVKVNLIPLNTDPLLPAWLATPSVESVDRFGAALAAAHLNVTVRWSKGREVSGACGQLRGALSAATEA